MSVCQAPIHQGGLLYERVYDLLRSPKWSHRVVDDFLWQQADQHVQTLLRQGQQALVVCESLASEGLCAVRSTKSPRYTHIKRGFYNPPLERPVFVPGFNWLAVMVMELAGTPSLAAMRW